MTSAVQICNMALSHIGSDGRVSSISPPDGSVEAGHCAAFYDAARTEMLELGNWYFALKRAALAQTANESTTWAYAYVLPSDCIRPRRVLDTPAGLTVFNIGDRQFSPNDDDSAAFTLEGGVLYTNTEDAVLLYTRDVTDTGQFTPSFSNAFGRLLSSYLAGPIIKGNDGARMGDAMRERAMAMAAASAADAANASSGGNNTPVSLTAVRA